MKQRKQIEDMLWLRIGHKIIDQMDDGYKDCDDYNVTKEITQNLDHYLMGKIWSPSINTLGDQVADLIRQKIQNQL